MFNGFPQQRIPDVRYTSKGNTVYAIVRHTPGTEVLLRSFTPADKVRSVKCLYTGHKPQWTLTGKGLSVRLKSPALKANLMMGREGLVRRLNDYVGAQVIVKIVFC